MICIRWTRRVEQKPWAWRHERQLDGGWTKRLHDTIRQSILACCSSLLLSLLNDITCRGFGVPELGGVHVWIIPHRHVSTLTS
jgi:hypothetical protein